MESYEEKYKQALEKATSALGTGNYNRETLKLIFPELAGVDDKWIKKRIISFISANHKDDGEKAEWLHWLEKQGKQEYIEGSEEEKIRKWLIDLLSAMQYHHCDEDMEMGNKALIWLKSLKPQPKQGWNKEDMDMLEGIITFICFNTHGSNNADRIDWLRSLKERVQLKQEWSEEDEKRLKTIVSLVNSNPAQDPFYDKSCLIDWLNSLRPQNRWKPSDEQMVALKHAFNDGSIDFADMKILATLYEQLKAL